MSAPAPNWLADFFDLAASKNWCTSIYCTTCGARDFRLGLQRATARAMGKPAGFVRIVGHPFDDEPGLVLARALAELPEPTPEQRKHHDAVKMTLHELWMASGGDATTHARLDPILKGSWAGRVLDGMFSHQAEVRAERREFEAFNAPEAVAARREAKRAAKAAAHAARLAAKVERDKAWRESHLGGD